MPSPFGSKYAPNERSHPTRIFLTAILVVLIGAATSLASDPEPESSPQLYRFESIDGYSVIGTIVEQDSTHVVITTSTGTRMDLPRSSIIEMEKIFGKLHSGKFYRQDPNYSRLFFAPTGRALRPSEGYISDYWIFFPFVGYGAGAGITIAGGISLLPGATEQLFYLAPKLTFIQSERLNIATGVIHFGITGVDNEGGAGIYYVVGTMGDPEGSLTAGLGWGYAGTDVSDRPILMLGGDYQIGRGSKVLAEWWFPPGTDVSLLGFGLRFFGERLSWDFAFLRPMSADMEGGFPFLPWIDVSYSFGGN